MMIAMTERTNVELREAFLELAMGEGYPDPDTLDAFVRLFPDHAEELTNFAIDLVITSRANEDESFVAAEGGALDVEVASALSAFQNALFAARQTAHRAFKPGAPGSSASPLANSPPL